MWRGVGGCGGDGEARTSDSVGLPPGTGDLSPFIGAGVEVLALLQRSSADLLSPEADNWDAMVVMVRTWFSKAARDVEKEGSCCGPLLLVLSSSRKSGLLLKSSFNSLSLSLSFSLSRSLSRFSSKSGLRPRWSPGGGRGDIPGMGNPCARNGLIELGRGNAAGGGYSLISAACICSGVRSVGSPVCSRMCC